MPAYLSTFLVHGLSIFNFVTVNHNNECEMDYSHIVLSQATNDAM